MPYAITGPAILKIFAPVPITIPSALNSRAGDTTEFAKPVMGTIVPKTLQHPKPWFYVVYCIINTTKSHH